MWHVIVGSLARRRGAVQLHTADTRRKLGANARSDLVGRDGGTCGHVEQPKREQSGTRRSGVREPLRLTFVITCHGCADRACFVKGVSSSHDIGVR